MKKLSYASIAIVIVASGLWLARRPIYQFVVTTHKNEKLSGFALQDLAGNTIRTSDYTGKVLVLDFWNTW